MKLTVFLALLAFCCSFALRLGRSKRLNKVKKKQGRISEVKLTVFLAFLAFSCSFAWRLEYFTRKLLKYSREQYNTASRSVRKLTVKFSVKPRWLFKDKHRNEACHFSSEELIGNRHEFFQVFKDEIRVSGEPTPTIDFTGDWGENVHGKIGVGRKFLIKYNGSRLSGRPTMYGKPSWKIYVEYKFNDGPDFKSEDFGSPTMIDGEEIFQKTISIPLTAEKVVMWFKHWSYYGGNKYDSNYGSNYNFEITAPSIVFDDQWNEIVHGKLSAGNSFDLFYDSKRLKEGVEVIAQMKFVDDNVLTKQLGMIANSSFETAEIYVPQIAEKLVMWFYYTDENGEKQYDSNYGVNYHFSLQ